MTKQVIHYRTIGNLQA